VADVVLVAVTQMIDGTSRRDQLGRALEIARRNGYTSDAPGTTAGRDRAVATLPSSGGRR
jgi:hypothetical protein